MIQGRLASLSLQWCSKRSKESKRVFGKKYSKVQITSVLREQDKLE